MCRSIAEGGLRCAGHTRPRYLAATLGTDEWDDAAAEYAATSAGRSEIESLSLSLLDRGDFENLARATIAIRRGETNAAAAMALRGRLSAQAVAATRAHEADPCVVRDAAALPLAAEDEPQPVALRSNTWHVSSPRMKAITTYLVSDSEFSHGFDQAFTLDRVPGGWQVRGDTVQIRALTPTPAGTPTTLEVGSEKASTVAEAMGPFLARVDDDEARSYLVQVSNRSAQRGGGVTISAAR